MAKTIIDLWTYQDIASACNVHPKTVSRWIKARGLRVWRPTNNTVRIPDDQVRILMEGARP